MRIGYYKFWNKKPKRSKLNNRKDKSIRKASKAANIKRIQVF